jgi:hypothetical protein
MAASTQGRDSACAGLEGLGAHSETGTRRVVDVLRRPAFVHGATCLQVLRIATNDRSLFEPFDHGDEADHAADRSVRDREVASSNLVAPI